MPDRWQGWRPSPPLPTAAGVGPWLELSHPLRADLSGIAFLPTPRFARIMSMPADPLNVTEIQMVCHFGTHVDAPCHFIADGPAFHDIPLERLCGPGVVWRVDAEPYGTIDATTLARLTPPVRSGDIVLLDTGWAAYNGTPEYERHPCLTVDAAEWLVALHVTRAGSLVITPDLA